MNSCPFASVLVPLIICPECDEGLESAGEFEVHMLSEHPHKPASLGFGRTLQT